MLSIIHIYFLFQYFFNIVQIVDDRLRPVSVLGSNKKAPTTSPNTSKGAQQNNQQFSQNDVSNLIVKDAYNSRLSLGVILVGAIRSIDGNHQWMPTSPPLPRVGANYTQSERDCRRYGYPGSGPYAARCDGDDRDYVPRNPQKPGFVLYRPEYRDTVFRKLFRPIAPKLCEFVGYPYPGVMCEDGDGVESGVAFPPHFLHAHGSTMQLATNTSRDLRTRAARTTFNMKARESQTKQTQSRQAQSRQTQSRTQSRQTQAGQTRQTQARQTQSRQTQARQTASRTTQTKQSQARQTSRQQTTAKRTQPRTDQASMTRTQKNVRPERQPTKGKEQVSQRPGKEPAKRPARESSNRRPLPQDSFLGFESNANNAVPSWRNSYLLSLLSYASYPGVAGSPNAPVVNPAALGQQLDAWDLRLVSWVDERAQGKDSGSTQMLAATTDDALIFSVQGSTMSMTDMGRDWWDNDLDLNPQARGQWGRGVVLHDGFIDAAKLVFPRIRQIIQQHGGNRKIWFTGHSLGGAVAVLSAMYVEKEMRREVQGVYIYGAPPVGNANWASAYRRAIPNTHRWSLENDPVTAVMLQFPGTPFRHVGRRHNMDEYTARVNDRHELRYSPERGARHLFTDLAGTHMQYWCRLHTEASNRNVGGLPQPPRFDCAKRCEW